MTCPGAGFRRFSISENTARTERVRAIVLPIGIDYSTEKLWSLTGTMSKPT
jgi:hypothetical protein